MDYWDGLRYTNQNLHPTPWCKGSALFDLLVEGLFTTRGKRDEREKQRIQWFGRKGSEGCVGLSFFSFLYFLSPWHWQGVFEFLTRYLAPPPYLIDALKRTGQTSRCGGDPCEIGSLHGVL